MNEKKISQIKKTGIIVLLIFVFAIIVYSSHEIRQNLSKEMQSTLKDVAQQNVIAVNKEIESKFSLLESAAEELNGDTDNIEEFLDNMKQVVNVYHFKRIGFIYPDGMVHTTDGWVQNLSYRDFFKEAMKGKRIVTDVLADSIGDVSGPINVFSIPVYDTDGKTIIGVLFATYRTENFENVMAIRCFDEQGYGCVLDNRGNVIINSSQKKVASDKNVLDFLKQDKENKKIASQIEDAMEDRKSISGSYMSEEEKYFYLTPLSTNDGEADWYMMTIVPEKILSQRLYLITSRINLLLFVVVVIAIACVGLYMYSYKRSQKKLYELAYMDTLTGGPNYEYLNEYINRENRKAGYLVAIDMIGFKIINSTCGVATGDEALKAIFKVLETSVTDKEVAAHVNGDRYLLYLLSEGKEELIQRLEVVSDKICALSEKLHVPSLIPSFGIYWMDRGEKLTGSYSCAIEAKALIKGRRDKNYAFYEEVDKEEAIRRREMEDQFETALQKKEFEVWYQPKFGVDHFDVVGAEALIRWRGEDGKLIPPGKFIPIFEKNGMISKLDEYIFREVCRQQKEWEDAGRKMHPISVNISRASLYFESIVERYRNILDGYCLDARWVELEITESAIIDSARISQLIEKFHQAGFHMLLDDFGNGYSSLSSLNMLHFDTLKLDKSLVDYIGDKNGETLLYYITKLAQNLGLYITAEGVETKEQVEYVKKLQCTDIQGFYFSKPLPVKEYEKIM